MVLHTMYTGSIFLYTDQSQNCYNDVDMYRSKLKRKKKELTKVFMKMYIQW